MNPVRNQKLKIFANLHTGWVSNGMKKRMLKSAALALLTSSLLISAHVAHAYTYSCVGGSGRLAPIEVTDPRGLDGLRVATYNQSCLTSGGTPSGPSAQQLEPPPEPKKITSQADCGPNETFYPQISDMGEGGGVCQPNAIKTTNSTVPTTQQQTSNPNAFCKNGRCDYVPLEPLPCQEPSGNCGQTGNNFPAFVSAIFRALITVGGLFAVVMIVVAGIGYMISESAVDIEKAKHRAQAALWGLLLLAGSWLILNTINPRLLEFNLNALEELRTMLPGSSSGPAGALSPAGSSFPTAQQRSECERNGGAVQSNPGNNWTCHYY